MTGGGVRTDVSRGRQWAAILYARETDTVYGTMAGEVFCEWDSVAGLRNACAGERNCH